MDWTVKATRLGEILGIFCTDQKDGPNPPIAASLHILAQLPKAEVLDGERIGGGRKGAYWNFGLSVESRKPANMIIRMLAGQTASLAVARIENESEVL